MNQIWTTLAPPVSDGVLLARRLALRGAAAADLGATAGPKPGTAAPPAAATAAT